MSYEEQIMSKDKYPNIFSPQMEAIVFIIMSVTLSFVLFPNEYFFNLHLLTL